MVAELAWLVMLDAVAALMIGKQAILKRNEEEIEKLSLKINVFCNWSTPEVHGTVLTRFESEEAFHADLNKKWKLKLTYNFFKRGKLI